MTTLTAFYDLAVGPVSFDFVVFATKAKMVMRERKCDRLHIVFVPDANGPGGFRDKRQFFDQHEAKWRFWNICVPACALVGATFTYAEDWDQAVTLARPVAMAEGRVWPDDWSRQRLKNRHHLVGDIITWCMAGQKVPMLQASTYARAQVRKLFANRDTVTMTKRGTYLTERNSDEAVWAKVRAHLYGIGFNVFEIPDTSFTLAHGRGYAELNLDLRMACYQEAALNLQANNGAASLCWFSDKPYRMFGAGDADWKGLFVDQGLPLGETWPWAYPQQKICYGKETAESMMAEVEEWISGLG